MIEKTNLFRSVVGIRIVRMVSSSQLNPYVDGKNSDVLLKKSGS